jgi:hypothetical protein
MPNIIRQVILPHELEIADTELQKALESEGARIGGPGSTQSLTA